MKTGQAQRVLAAAFDVLRGAATAFDDVDDVDDVDDIDEVDRAADRDERIVDVSGLLWAWRAHAPHHHPGAGADVVDVAALAGVLARFPNATDGAPFVVGDVVNDARGVGADVVIAATLADACVFGLEQEKLRHGLLAPPAALRSHFDTPESARHTLVRVRDAAVPVVVARGLGHDVDVRGVTDATVFVGDGATRLLDLLSPYVRRHRVELALVGRRGVVDDDDVYRGLATLFAHTPDALAERRSVEAEVGVTDGGGVFVIDVDRLREDDVDRRARSLIAPLKKQLKGGALVGVVDVALLPAVLAQLPRVRAVRALVRGTVTSAPRVVVGLDGRAHYATGADAPLRTVPSLALASVHEDSGVGVDDVLAAVAAADVDRAVVDVRAVAVNDDSAAALAALAAVVRV